MLDYEEEEEEEDEEEVALEEEKENWKMENADSRGSSGEFMGMIKQGCLELSPPWWWNRDELSFHRLF